ncbi:MAG TPA: TadG family pilus assembly protein [Tepidisphaeraceae bacterium]|jgi:hypothetical protein
MVYAVLCLTALSALAVLVIDWGRFQLTRTEMRRTADAIAIYAAAGVSDGTYLTRAQAAATDNVCSDTQQAITLQSSDVVSGQWNDTTKTFSSGGATPNAVCVTLVRSAARGNPLRLFFGPIINRNTVNLTVTSIAKLDGAMPDGAYNYGWIGMNSTNFSGSGRVDAYASAKAAYAFPGTEASIGTNGSHAINGSTVINGNANYGPSGGISNNAPAVISGDKIKLNQAFSFSPYTNGTYTTTVSGSGYTLSAGALTISNGGVVNLSAGTWSFSSINVNAGGRLNITATGVGSSIAYVYANTVNFYGRQAHSGQIGNNRSTSAMYLLMSGAGGVNINAQNDIYGIFVGPTAPLNLSGTSSLYGFGIFSSMDVTGSASLHHDTSLGQIVTSDASKNIVTQWPPNPSNAGRSIIVR